MTIQRMEDVGNVRDPEGIIVGLAEQIGRGLRPAANRLADVSGRPGAGSPNGTPLPLSERMRTFGNAPRRLSHRTSRESTGRAGARC